MSPDIMKHKRWIIAIAVLALAAVTVLMWRHSSSDDTAAAAASPAPVLTVTAATVDRVTWPSQIEASGPIAAWQEALVGARITGLPLAEVRAEVGDTVHRGQLLARFDDRTVRAEIAQAEASLAQAQAEAREAAANRDRALAIEASGALSKQQVLQNVTQAETAAARQRVAEASLAASRVKLENTRVIAPDDGLISARNATLGQVADAASSGELFRLIRQGRLEWRGRADPGAAFTGHGRRQGDAASARRQRSQRHRAPGRTRARREFAGSASRTSISTPSARCARRCT